MASLRIAASMWPALTLVLLGVADALLRAPRTNSHPLLVTHHKTGTVLAIHVQTCLATEGLRLEGTWHGLEENMTDYYSSIAVFVRNPFATVASGYLYHKDVGEAWTKEEGSAALLMRETVCETAFDLNPEDSYTDLLKRLPQEQGLMAELCWFSTQSERVLTSHKLCTAQPQSCIETCLEDFTRSSDSYYESWNRVLGFLGLGQVTQGTRLQECLAKEDLNDDGTRHNLKHTTAGMQADEERVEMEEYVKNLAVNADTQATLRRVDMQLRQLKLHHASGDVGYSSVADLEVALRC